MTLNFLLYCSYHLWLTPFHSFHPFAVTMGGYHPPVVSTLLWFACVVSTLPWLPLMWFPHCHGLHISWFACVVSTLLWLPFSCCFQPPMVCTLLGFAHLVVCMCGFHPAVVTILMLFPPSHGLHPVMVYMCCHLQFCKQHRHLQIAQISLQSHVAPWISQ